MQFGHQKAEALIGWYAFKGTDNTVSFAGRGVLSHFKAFLEEDNDILDVFAIFGLTNEVPNWIVGQIVHYLCLLYKTAGINACALRELRWALFAQKSREGQQLPPTLGTFIPHTPELSIWLYCGSHHKKCGHNFRPLLPTTRSLWITNSSQSTASILQLQMHYLRLEKCYCNTRCKKRTCGCHKSVLKCTYMCGFGIKCENSARDRPFEVDKAN